MVTNSDSLMIRKQVEAAIIKKCIEDKSFERAFVENPEKALSDAFGIPPDKLGKIKVHTEKAGEWMLVIPSEEIPQNEISDDDLENVSGGISPGIYFAAAGVSALAGYVINTET
jgi:hypothetical protein